MCRTPKGGILLTDLGMLTPVPGTPHRHHCARDADIVILRASDWAGIEIIGLAILRPSDDRNVSMSALQFTKEHQMEMYSHNRRSVT